MKPVVVALLIGLGAAAAAAPAASPSLEGVLQEALAAARAGRPAELVAALDRARLQASLARGLSIDVATATLGPHRGLGVWEPLPGGVVPGRALHLYLEVDGVTPAPERDGRFRHELAVTARFVVVGKAGDEVLGEKALGRHSVVARRALPLQAVGAEMVLGAAPAGDYAADVTVTDVATNASATRRVAFALR
jgi:hypothetical protein